MSFNKGQFKALIEETLKEIGMHSDAAVNLLLGTAAQESLFGTYLWQVNGPALGVFQMEPATHDDIWKNYLRYRTGMSDKLLQEFDVSEDCKELITDLKYAIIMARLHYRRVSEQLPGAEDVMAMGKYWKKYYNTEKGKGTVLHFIRNYKKYVEV